MLSFNLLENSMKHMKCKSQANLGTAAMEFYCSLDVLSPNASIFISASMFGPTKRNVVKASKNMERSRNSNHCQGRWLFSSIICYALQNNLRTQWHCFVFSFSWYIKRSFLGIAQLLTHGYFCRRITWLLNPYSRGGHRWLVGEVPLRVTSHQIRKPLK